MSQIDKVIEIDQSPIGRTPRSNPATYTGLFTFIRDLFAMVPEAKARGYRPGRFSFNVKGGRCEACQGDGVIAIEMHFLPDVFVTCEQCKGRRYNRETLDVRYRGKSIAEVLDLTVSQALPLLENFPLIANKLRTLESVGLGYVDARPVGDDAVGRRGAAGQAVARAVQARHRPHALHPRRADDRPALRRRAQAARRAEPAGRPGQHRARHRAQPRRHQGGRLGRRPRPEGGEGGGRFVAQGPPEAVARSKASYTGHFLAEVLGATAVGCVNPTTVWSDGLWSQGHTMRERGLAIRVNSVEVTT